MLQKQVEKITIYTTKWKWKSKLKIKLNKLKARKKEGSRHDKRNTWLVSIHVASRQGI